MGSVVTAPGSRYILNTAIYGYTDILIRLYTLISPLWLQWPRSLHPHSQLHLPLPFTPIHTLTLPPIHTPMHTPIQSGLGLFTLELILGEAGLEYRVPPATYKVRVVF